jgi:hypothetical protein
VRRSQIGVVIAVVVLAAGRSREPDEKGAAADADRARAAVVSQLKDAAAALVRGDVAMGGLSGGFSGCGGGELSARQARYTAGGDVTGGAGTVSDRIVLAIRVLEAAGWRVTSEGTTPQGDAYGRLSRDGVELSVDRDPLEGSEEFGVDVAGPCFKVTDEQYSDLPDDEQIVP